MTENSTLHDDPVMDEWPKRLSKNRSCIHNNLRCGCTNTTDYR